MATNETWRAPVVVGLVLAAIAAASGILSNYQQYVQQNAVQTATLKAGSAPNQQGNTPAISRPAEAAAVSAWPFVLNSFSLLVMLALVPLIARYHVRAISEQNRHISSLFGHAGRLETLEGLIDPGALKGTDATLSKLYGDHVGIEERLAGLERHATEADTALGSLDKRLVPLQSNFEQLNGFDRLQQIEYRLRGLEKEIGDRIATVRDPIATRLDEQHDWLKVLQEELRKVQRAREPRLVPLRQESKSTGSYALICANDGGNAAYDATVGPIRLGGANGWLVKFREVARVRQGDDEAFEIEISHRQTTMSNLGDAMEAWHREEMVHDPNTGKTTFPEPVQFIIVYRDHLEQWYRSRCEMSRDVLVSSGITFRLVSSERLPKRPA